MIINSIIKHTFTRFKCNCNLVGSSKTPLLKLLSDTGVMKSINHTLNA